MLATMKGCSRLAILLLIVTNLHKSYCTLFKAKTMTGERDLISTAPLTIAVDPIPLPLPDPTVNRNYHPNPPFNLTFNPFQNRGENEIVVRNGPNGSFNPDQDRSKNCDVSDSLFQYKENYMTRAVFIPCFVLLLTDTFLLIYTIIRYLKKIIKLYISVLFYAMCQVLLLLALLFSMMFSQLFADTMATCRARMPLQTMAILLPGFAVLVITFIRYIFLKFPLNYRNILCMRYQIVGFICTVIFAALLANLPNFGLCSYVLTSYGEDGLPTCEYDNVGGTCTAFYGLLIGLGFVLPPVGVSCFYIGIYVIILRHRNIRKRMTTSSLRGRVTTKITSVDGPSASDSLMNSSTVSETRDVKENKKEEQERDRIPWSILVILFLHILSTVPWIPQELYPHLVYGCQNGEIVFLIDLMWTVLLVSVSISPLAYLLTTQTVRDQVKKLVCGCCKREKKFNKLKNLSNV